MTSARFIISPSHSIVRAMTLARNRLLAHVRRTASEPDAHFLSAFTALVAAVECAFRNEETLMEAIGDPALQKQRQDNALLLAALHHAASQVEAGKLTVGREVMAVLPGLLSMHRFCALNMLGYRIASAPRGVGGRKPRVSVAAAARRARLGMR